MNTNFVKMALLVIATALPFYASADMSDSISNTADQVGDSVMEAGDAVGTATTDTAITTAVKAKFATDSSIPSGISVTTVSGVVYLVGTADSQAQIDKAVSAAQSVSGVTKVDASKLLIKN